MANHAGSVVPGGNAIPIEDMTSIALDREPSDAPTKWVDEKSNARGPCESWCNDEACDDSVGAVTVSLARIASEHNGCFSTLLGQASTPIVLLDASGTVVEVNDAALAAGELTRSGRGMRTEFWKTSWWNRSPEVQARIRAAVEAAAGGQRSTFESPFFTASGENRRVELSFTPLCDRERVVAILVEGHEIHKAEPAGPHFDTVRDALVRSAKAREAAFAALVHELRTPLQPILLVASEAAQDEDLEPSVRSSFETIAKQVAMEVRLIDDLLDLTRVTHGKMALNLEHLDLHAVVRDALRIVEAEIRQKQLAVDLCFAPNNPVVKGDALRLQQVFGNLLKNAVKFTGTGGRVVVETHWDTERDHVIIRVLDSGIGITGEELDRVFRPFGQGDHATGGGSRAFGGLGLGLTISRAIVELHAGHISAASEGRGKGACFTVRLPTISAPAISPPQPLPLQSAGARSSPPAARRTRILLVEDHAPSRVTLARILKRRGFDVTAAGSLHDAMTAAATTALDVLLSDITLPDGNGYQLLAALRDLHPAIVSVSMSGHAAPDDIERSRQAGFISHLAKPVSLPTLAAVLDQIVELPAAAEQMTT